MESACVALQLVLQVCGVRVSTAAAGGALVEYWLRREQPLLFSSRLLVSGFKVHQTLGTVPTERGAKAACNDLYSFFVPTRALCVSSARGRQIVRSCRETRADEGSGVNGKVR